MTLVIQINAAVIAMYYLHYPREACWMHQILTLFLWLYGYSVIKFDIYIGVWKTDL